MSHFFGRPARLFFAVVGTVLFASRGAFGDAVVDMNTLAGAAVRVAIESNRLVARWQNESGQNLSLTLNLDAAQPLIHAISLNDATVVREVDPVLLLTVGKRNLGTPAGWTMFFDNPIRRPHQTFPAKISRERVAVHSRGGRAVISVSGLTAGPFSGQWQFTIYGGTSLVRSEAIVQTELPDAAILYDAGLSAAAAPGDTNVSYTSNADQPVLAIAAKAAAADAYAVRRRAIAMSANGAALAIVAPPHQFLYPLDFCDNYKLAWHGQNYRGMVSRWGIGLRQPPEGDKRWVPWVNAPAGTIQHLALFYVLTPGDGMAALEEAGKLTNNDSFKPLPGYVTFTSHIHQEHAIDVINARLRQGNNELPPDLAEPDFVKTLKRTGVDIAHLAEFHVDHKSIKSDRVSALKTLHDECQRLSTGEFLLLPGEEPNAHLGGHWISFFPKPVLWTLDRKPGQAFMEEVNGEKVYHVGSPDDVLKLMQAENGLMWTAHPRIKASEKMPDAYRDQPFFKSDRYLGAAWKNMPADYSLDRLGKQVLNLLDDMNNWGDHKLSPGEIDLFRIDSRSELYGHMNINYLKLDKLPAYNDGWRPVLDVLRGGRFFVTTGEVLIPKFTLGGVGSGGKISPADASGAVLEADLQWTYPLAFAEIVSGDGRQTYRQRIDLSDTASHGKRHLSVPVDLTGRTWARFEVWDVATNGAFTQPIWIK